MGALLSSLREGKPAALNIVIDFDPQPHEAEQALWSLCNEVLARGPEILAQLQGYSGCEEYIRKAITTPTPQTEEEAWKAVLPAVDKLQGFFDFASELENIFPTLLVALCAEDPKHTLANKQALAKQLADVLDFVLRFDDAKMVNPAIQNDFSYYRRTLNRMKINKKDGNVKVRDELANRMSLFFAYPTPMMKVLSDATSKYLAGDAEVSREAVSEGLSVMCTVCYEMVAQNKFENIETNVFCLRAMTGSIILFDHIDAQGAFIKKSPINMKGCIQLLKQYQREGRAHTEGLLNALRFTTVHLNDESTSGAIKSLLNDG